MNNSTGAKFTRKAWQSIKPNELKRLTIYWKGFCRMTSAMHKYELINPSDKIFYEAPDAVHSAVATALISTGYGGNCLTEGGENSPIFLMHSASEWIEKRSGMTVDEFIEKNAESLYEVLSSFRYSSERTSLNKIVDTAHQYAEAIKKKFLGGKKK